MDGRKDGWMKGGRDEGLMIEWMRDGWLDDGEMDG